MPLSRLAGLLGEQRRVVLVSSLIEAQLIGRGGYPSPDQVARACTSIAGLASADGCSSTCQ